MTSQNTDKHEQKVINAFQEYFGYYPETLIRAPGRVNLIGEHTDYNNGYVMPVAIDRAAWIAAAPAKNKLTRIISLDLQKQAEFLLSDIPVNNAEWSDYPRGVAWALRELGFDLVEIDAVISSEVPIGAGLSSSAALEVAFALAWQSLSGFNIDRQTLAVTCRAAENEYVKVNCGIMDQIASACCKKDNALLLDCRNLYMEHIPLPLGISLVIADSKIRRQLSNSEYNIRRSQCDEAVEILKKHIPGISSLADVSLDDLERFKKYLSELLYKRANHVVNENRRVLLGADKLKNGDAAGFGVLMKESHASLACDYEVSLPELDTLVNAASEVEGCYGGRLTGAGFGGCVIAIAESGAVSGLKTHLVKSYKSAFNRVPDVYICNTANGAEILK